MSASKTAVCYNTALRNIFQPQSWISVDAAARVATDIMLWIPAESWSVALRDPIKDRGEFLQYSIPRNLESLENHNLKV